MRCVTPPRRVASAVALSLVLSASSACLPAPDPGSPEAWIVGARQRIVQGRLELLRSRVRQRQRERGAERFYVLWDAPARRWGVGSEALWVWAVVWEGDEVMGLLASHPRRHPHLRSGGTVTFPEQQVVDYAVVRAGERVEGAELDRALGLAREVAPRP